MKPDADLDDLSTEELKSLVRQLRIKAKNAGELTKSEILTELAKFEELDLTENAMMNVQESHNMGLRKSGWLKVYEFVERHSKD